MKPRFTSAFPLASLLLAGLALAPALPAPAAADDEGDVKAGARVYARCKACHTVEQGGANKVGPNLWGIFGAEAGGRDIGFNYSKAMRESGIVWNEETLGAYLENPRKAVPGTRMVFAGLKNEDQREDVIAYLKSVTQ